MQPSSPQPPDERPSRHFFIHTFGCQMNEVDSLRIAEQLRGLGFARAESPEQADLILLNTCSVRDKAEQKVLSALGRYRQHKLERGTLLAVGGCVAQQEKERLLKRVPYLDFVFGPDAIARLPELLKRVEGRERVADTGWIDSSQYVFARGDAESSRGKVSEFVTVMKGCDNHCAYCVVPQVRGRETSRPVAEVLEEVRALVAVGVREVGLIGQNVNSYRGGTSFARLVEQVCAVEGLARVRFTTSHPRDLSDELIGAFGSTPKLMPHFHLPLQSGSDRILERMGRGYGAAWYLGRLESLRRARPDVAVTTDVIVGFPGESEEDFQRTFDLCEQVRFENIYSFVYSPRPNTLAARKEGEWGPVPYATKVERLERLQARARAISLESAQKRVGTKMEVLVEGASKHDPTRRFGRTPDNRVVNFEGAAAAGALAQVEIVSASPNALFGIERAA